ncbi:energy-coupling factor ABC transporter permease [Chitinilyticum piscinae]|uniref:Energy-coupling factor ABC transporter permease n=1 Tax=Chitinilyticum piscinae TaxID=2866724 RepID=A0A8J7FIE7_9NEIS|nr:energy-coupling factor ABC transporter permease [Chitinilyticum piscinae]MBE9610023.1 energy-coupling factor ABC transporter permease [Chitinilyticum piscinae]
MHIPTEMLHGSVCSVSAALAIAGIALAAHAARKSPQQPGVLRFAAVSALIFVAQMLNFPVAGGTSGHLLGGVLAAALLGVPFGVLAIALVLGVQALLFADGGLAALGANVLVMALLGAGAGGMLNRWLQQRGLSQHMALLLAAWLSVLLAAAMCSFLLALGGVADWSSVLPAMLGVHARIGAGEALLTALLVPLFAGKRSEAGNWQALLPVLGGVLVALLLSPLASSQPDGLEWVAQQYGFLRESAPLFVSPLADYNVAALGESFWSTVLAGLAGVLAVAVAGGVLAWPLHRRRMWIAA